MSDQVLFQTGRMLEAAMWIVWVAVAIVAAALVGMALGYRERRREELEAGRKQSADRRFFAGLRMTDSGRTGRR